MTLKFVDWQVILGIIRVGGGTLRLLILQCTVDFSLTLTFWTNKVIKTLIGSEIHELKRGLHEQSYWAVMEIPSQVFPFTHQNQSAINRFELFEILLLDIIDNRKHNPI